MPSKADVKAWKAQLVAQAEQQILKLTDSDRFKQYLNTLAKFHHYSARNIDLIYAQNPQATQVAGFKQWQTAFNRTVNRGAKAIRIAAPIIKKLTPAEQKRLDTTDERAIVFQKYVKSIRLRPIPTTKLMSSMFQKYVKSIRLRPVSLA